MLKNVVLPFQFHARSEAALLATQWYMHGNHWRSAITGAGERSANDLKPFQRMRFQGASIAKMPSDLMLYSEILYKTGIILIIGMCMRPKLMDGLGCFPLFRAAS